MLPHATRSRQQLIALLQLAYSGELAAAHAYRGHAASVADADEKDHIRVIEPEEWHHRRSVGRMLSELGARPNGARELRAMAIGRALGLACRISGWFAPPPKGSIRTTAWASPAPAARPTSPAESLQGS